MKKQSTIFCRLILTGQIYRIISLLFIRCDEKQGYCDKVQELEIGGDERQDSCDEKQISKPGFDERQERGDKRQD